MSVGCEVFRFALSMPSTIMKARKSCGGQGATQKERSPMLGFRVSQALSEEIASGSPSVRYDTGAQKNIPAIIQIPP